MTERFVTLEDWKIHMQGYRIVPEGMSRKKFRRWSKSAKYRCILCDFKFRGRPGSTLCQKESCRSIYVHWFNYETLKLELY